MIMMMMKRNDLSRLLVSTLLTIFPGRLLKRSSGQKDTQTISNKKIFLNLISSRAWLPSLLDWFTMQWTAHPGPISRLHIGGWCGFPVYTPRPQTPTARCISQWEWLPSPFWHFGFLGVSVFKRKRWMNVVRDLLGKTGLCIQRNSAPDFLNPYSVEVFYGCAWPEVRSHWCTSIQ